MRHEFADQIEEITNREDGTGIMYTVMVDGKECHLYYEFDKWFMERKSA